MWSGNPNGTLVHEVAGLPPGRALDVGAGEGGDAIWLAERGWSVTATDISARALDRVAGRGRGVGACRSSCRTPTPTRPTRSARRRLRPGVGAATPRSRARRTAAVSATCSTRSRPAARCSSSATTSSRCATPIDTSEHSRMFDPDAYVRVDDVAAGARGDAGLGRRASTRSGPARRARAPRRTTSTTSCCG